MIILWQGGLARLIQAQSISGQEAITAKAKEPDEWGEFPIL